MSFDLAIGVNGAELNTASPAIYTKLYPKVFTGSQKSSYLGIDYTVGWDVKVAPTFDLSAPSSDEFLINQLRDRALTDALDTKLQEAPNLSAVASAIPTFTVHFSEVDISIQGGVTVNLKLDFTANCSVQITGNILSFDVNSVTVAQQSDPVQNYLVQHIVAPQIQSILQDLFKGITIPPISVEGIDLSVPSVGIVNNSVIAAVNLLASGTPPPPDSSTPWPASPFFALLGNNVVQKVMENALASATNNFSNHGSGGDHWAGYHWSYGLSLRSPQTSISGTSIDLKVSLGGEVSGGVEVVYVPLTLGLKAGTIPSPIEASLGIKISGTSAEIVMQDVHTFTIYVTPNSVPGWVLGWLVTAIVNGIVLSITPIVTSFLKNINVQGFDIPTYSISVSGESLTLTPGGLQMSNVAGYLAAEGHITIT